MGRLLRVPDFRNTGPPLAVFLGNQWGWYERKVETEGLDALPAGLSDVCAGSTADSD